MKSKTVISALTLAAMSMAFAGAALAQSGGDTQVERGAPRALMPGGDHGHAGPQQYRNDRNQARGHDRGRGYDQAREHDERDERGAGPDHNFRRGQRLSDEYRNRQYVVDDWREHHLNAPPRGYHWVQVGADYVLVAIATGIIAQVLLSQ